VIATELDEDIALASLICTIAKKEAPEYNIDAIYDALQKKSN